MSDIVKPSPYTNKPKIDVYHDYVVIETKEIPRPLRMSPMQWLDFWESANRMDDEN